MKYYQQVELKPSLNNSLITINTACLYLHFNLIEKYILIKGVKHPLSWNEKLVKITHLMKQVVIFPSEFMCNSMCSHRIISLNK